MPARKDLKRLYFRWLEWLGRDRKALEHVRANDLVVVLNLHKVSPHPNPYWNPLHPDLLDDLVGFLMQHFRVTTFAGSRTQDPDRPTAVLSFDDGYHDFVEYVLPVLDRHGVHANQNLIGACVASGEPPWNVLLYDFLLAAPQALIDELEVPGFAPPPAAEDDRGKMRFALALSAHLKQRAAAERTEFWQPIADLMLRVDEFPRTRMMDLADVRALDPRHEVGCHSWSHESMAHESDAFFLDDLASCTAFFRDWLERPLTTYAFPNGSHRVEQIDLLLERGVENVLLVEEDFARRSGPVFKRFTMHGDSGAELRMRALGWGAGRGR